MQPEPIATPAPQAFCAEHSGQPSTGTCQRCGRFVCGMCEVRGETCTACQLRALPQARARAVWTRRWLGFRTVTAALNVLLWTVFLLLTTAAGFLLEENAESHDTVVGLLALPLLVSTLGSIIQFLRWQHLTVKTAEVLGRSQGVTPGSAMGSWFIPLVNLVRPFNDMKHLWTGLGGKATLALQAWWATWILSNLAAHGENVLGRGLEKGDNSLAAALIGSIISEAFTIASGVLCMRVVGHTQELLDARTSEALGTSDSVA